MKTGGSFVFHHKETGLFDGRIIFASNRKTLDANTPKDYVAMSHDESIDIYSERIDVATGKPVAWQPPAPSADHTWNAITRRWQLNDAAAVKINAAAAARAQIAALEASTPRLLRDLALGRPGALYRLQALDAEITELEKHFMNAAGKFSC